MGIMNYSTDKLYSEDPVILVYDLKIINIVINQLIN